MEDQKPVEEMTPLEMAGELNERRKADAGVWMLMQQVNVLKSVLANMGVLVAFSPEESEAIEAQLKAQREHTKEDFPND